jgi:hypothetical protein
MDGVETVVADDVREERRLPEPLLYSRDQLLGRTPIRLRRKSDKRRLVAHLVAATGLVALSGWWVIPLHSFAGPVLLRLTRTHGVHRGDLPALVFLLFAGWSLTQARRIVTPA